MKYRRSVYVPGYCQGDRKNTVFMLLEWELSLRSGYILARKLFYDSDTYENGIRIFLLCLLFFFFLVNGRFYVCKIFQVLRIY